jgi:hypothetical protein
VYTWLDAVKAALEEAAKDDVELRRSVSPDGKAPDGLVERIAARLSPKDVTTRKRRWFVRSRRPLRDDLFDQLRAVEDLNVDTPLVRSETVIADLAVESESATLTYEGRDIRFPARIAAELEFIVAADEAFRLADLPGRLDDEGRLVLARRLVREGFLRLA